MWKSFLTAPRAERLRCQQKLGWALAQQRRLDPRRRPAVPCRRPEGSYVLLPWQQAAELYMSLSQSLEDSAMDESRELEPLTEQVTDWHSPLLEVDRTARVVKHVLLSGDHSKNGHRYTAEALEAAVPLYERKPVFLDHARQPARPYDRSTRDLVGFIRNPQWSNGRIQGEIQVLETEAGQTFLGLVTAESPAVGMSHVVLAQRSTDRSVVERIQEVISVDAVVFPATTTGFTAQEAQGAESYEELQQRCQELERELSAQRTDHRLRDSGLPAVAISEVFRRQLQTAEPELQDALIGERQQLVQALAAAPVTSARRQLAKRNDGQELVRLLRGDKVSVLAGWS